MQINYLAILVCGVVAMVIGFIWYGPLFGKTWMSIMGVETMSFEQKEAMKKKMWVMYFIQFILSLITAFILSSMIWPSPNTVYLAFMVWLGLVMTTEASTALWSGKPAKIAWKMFFITASAQLVTFIAFGLIFSAWQ
jgi:Protein of unknown function (DUF1761)